MSHNNVYKFSFAPQYIHKNAISETETIEFMFDYMINYNSIKYNILHYGIITNI